MLTITGYKKIHHKFLKTTYETVFRISGKNIKLTEIGDFLVIKIHKEDDLQFDISIDDLIKNKVDFYLEDSKNVLLLNNKFVLKECKKDGFNKFELYLKEAPLDEYKS